MWGEAPAWEYQVGIRIFYKFSSQVCQILTLYIIYQYFFSAEQGAKKGRFRLLHITYNNHLVAVLPPANVLFKRRIKTNSILIQSKMALPNMWFEKIFAKGSISREQKMWLVVYYPAETEREEDDEELSRSKPNQSSKHQHLSRCEIEFLNLQIPHPLL